MHHRQLKTMLKIMLNQSISYLFLITANIRFCHQTFNWFSYLIKVSQDQSNRKSICYSDIDMFIFSNQIND